MIKQKIRGNLIIISGPSGAGKGTIVKKLVEENRSIWCSISATSRDPRDGEEEAREYFFLTKEEFKEKIDKGNFLEWAVYNDNYYGTPLDKINEKLNNGFDVILEIEIQGALQVKEIVPDAICIFILPPSMDELKQRLVNRGTETEDKILKRFRRAYEEINEVTKYNYVVVNDTVSAAVQKISGILIAERCRVDRIEEIYLDSKEEHIHEELRKKKFVNEERDIENG